MASSEQKQNKLRKLHDFKQDLPHCSQTALSAILDKVRKEGVPEQSSPKDIREASGLSLDSMTLYGALWQTFDAHTPEGKTLTLSHINVLSLLAGIFFAGGCFHDFMQQLHGKFPSSKEAPWRCVLYSDEVHPGHQLSSNSRKCWAIYFGFLEFGKALSREEVWLPIFICRSALVNQLASSIGQCFKAILEAMFNNPLANPLTGVKLKSSTGKHVILHWTLSMFLQDGSAQKFTFSNKQDAGSRVCMLCANIFLAKVTHNFSGEDEVEESQPSLHQFRKLKDLQLVQNDEILQSWHRMQRRKAEVSKTEWKDWCQASGLDYSDHALLLSTKLNELRLLQPSSQYCHDYMHALCSKGALCFIVFWLLDGLSSNGQPNVWKTLYEYLELWIPPLSFNAIKPHLLFQDKNVEGHKASKYLKCSASEMLSLYRPLAYYIRTCCLANNFLQTACLCFLAWCDVLDYCTAIPLLPKPNPKHLQVLVETALDLLERSGWGPNMRPKMHWPLHWPHALQRWQCLPACWTLERKHKVIRRHGGLCCNMAHYENFVMRETLFEQIAALTQQDTTLTASGCYLVKPHKPTKKMQAYLASLNMLPKDSSVFCAKSCKLDNGHVATVGDVVLFQKDITLPFRCGKLECLLDLGQLFGIVTEYTLVDNMVDKNAMKFDSTNVSKTLVPALVIESPVTHSFTAGSVVCLTPAHLKK